VQLAAVDPAISEDAVNGWAKDWATKFEREEKQFELGGLMTKLPWECAEKKDTPLDAKEEEGETTGDAASVKVGRKEMHEQREIFEELALTPNEMDAAGIKEYLDCIFLGITEEPRERPLRTCGPR
jgi:hypothetical protein